MSHHYPCALVQVEEEHKSHCLDYTVLHEMVHLIEKKHNDRFVAYLDKSLPNR
ncbi:MAG: DUF45 domain-containing protein [Leptospiraceae bacterium]|nr:DUF45 domain-containing protein [Leptospiraceae bacterium]MBK7056224.1 DUF45 domain-containing protein [Leptospiraceae bacterium]MBK9501476.1 DUF45 domain-containing protein [Leptospiraceae bacterium]MBL0266405.1 DUF45 domain-containing protein [Leptospiraceae bacterium]MBP9888262.1 DUF45 domain-containing protein [Leptospiraceae bacterium]